MRVLDERRSVLVRSVCELIVPGCARTGAEVYVDALLAGMPQEARDGALAAFDSLAEPAAGAAALAEHALSPEFQLVRALACEAYYSDFVAPGASGPGAWEEIDFRPPLAARLNKDWSYLGVSGE
ncbi:MAG TPA: hypothetical protein VGL51_15050 [Solirubrobacteraceae bacterium]|jgi:hypothetical protein